jgi:hypothetical protein
MQIHAVVLIEPEFRWRAVTILGQPVERAFRASEVRTEEFLAQGFDYRQHRQRSSRGGGRR